MAKIMIVDDDEDFVLAVSTILSKDGHESKGHLRTDGALEALRAYGPDLVILDVMFPEDSAAGFDLARQIHQDQALRSLPLLMLTAINTKFPLGFSSRDRDDEWMPVDSFLEKPVDFDVLRNKVGALLQQPGGQAEQ